MATYTRTLSQPLNIVGVVAQIYVADPHHVTVTSDILVAFGILYEADTTWVDNIQVAQTIVPGVDTGRDESDDLSLSQSVQGFIVYKNRTSGQTGSSFLDPAAQVVYDNLTPAKTVTFTQGGTTITLRAPNWGDRDKYDVIRVQEESRGRSLIVYQDSMWPKTEVLSLTFSHMDQTTADNILDFLVSSIGKSVTFIDHLGRTWSGYILNPDAEIQQPTRTNRTITLNFQGTLQ